MTYCFKRVLDFRPGPIFVPYFTFQKNRYFTLCDSIKSSLRSMAEQTLFKTGSSYSFISLSTIQLFLIIFFFGAKYLQTIKDSESFHSFFYLHKGPVSLWSHFSGVLKENQHQALFYNPLTQSIHSFLSPATTVRSFCQVYEKSSSLSCLT